MTPPPRGFTNSNVPGDEGKSQAGKRRKRKPTSTRALGSFEAPPIRKPVKGIGRFEDRCYDEHGRKRS